MEQSKHNITIKKNTTNKIVIGLNDLDLDAVITFKTTFNEDTCTQTTDIKCYIDPVNKE
ncbi:MAG: hypothetical protein Q620_VSAC01055G0007 [Veillonella sp. DORA_A_3_16_22]|jgi:hypothetical protein|nr:MAG: hypothetical protein Q620_VSAC01055G0007 [Veillonella sp. DORA_A_3_16_22]